MNYQNEARRSFIKQTILRTSLTSGVLASASTLGALADDDLSVDRAIKRRSLNAPLAMLFDGKTEADFLAWKSKFQQKLSSLLGDFRPPKNWKSKVVGQKDFGDFVRIQMVIESNGVPSLPLFLLKPKKTPRRMPAVLALHGHGDFGYKTVAGCDETDGVRAAIKKSNYDYGRQLVKRGYVVAVPCMTPFGVRRGPKNPNNDACAVAFVRMQLLGKVLMGENLRDCLWSIELLKQTASVDNERIGCVGLSYGGRMTMLTTALQPEIKISVISGALNVMQERILGRYSCGAQVIPGLLNYGDVPEIISLIAPRPCILETGNADKLIVEPWATRAMERIKKAYTACSKNNNLLRDTFEGGHRWNGAVAFEKMDQILKG